MLKCWNSIPHAQLVISDTPMSAQAHIPPEFLGQQSGHIKACDMLL